MDPTRNTKLAMPLFLMVLVFVLSFSEISCQTVPSSTSETGRNLIEVENISRPLDDTVRVDPLNKLKKYRGGYDITNLHYWSSTVFTGINGFALGVTWLLCGLVYGIFLLSTTFCCKSRKNDRKLKKRRSPCHKQCYLWPALLAAFFTILAITATGLVLGGNANFHSRAKIVVDIIIDTANNASETIYNTTGAMKDISGNLQAPNGRANTQATTFLLSTSQRLDSQAADLQREAKNNRRTIDLVLKILYIVSTLIFSLNLVALIALSVFGILKLRRGLHMLIILCWLLTALCWIFFGMYFFLEKFEGDTCKALEDFRQDPYNNSLSSILPCEELLSAKPLLFNVSQGVYRLINEVNANITLMQANSYFEICNPFSAPPEYTYQPENCPSNSIRIGDIPKALKLVTCVEDPSNGTCNGGIYMSTSNFNTVKAYTTSLQTLINAYPGMESLVECQTVKDAFSVILEKHCRPLRRYTRMVWAALVFLSTLMVALVLLWTTESHHERDCHSSDNSVKPHFGMMESGNVHSSESSVKPHFGAESMMESGNVKAMESGNVKAINGDSSPNSIL